jgi:hypothetical protein
LGTSASQTNIISTYYWFLTLQEAKEAMELMKSNVQQNIQKDNIIGLELYEANKNVKIGRYYQSGYYVIFSKTGGPFFKQDFFDHWVNSESLSGRAIEPYRLNNKLLDSWICRN